jgi:hypothetical protein
MTHILAEYDSFRAEQDDGDLMVHILDGEGTIRLSMDYETWERFTEDAVRRRILDGHESTSDGTQRGE